MNSGLPNRKAQPLRILFVVHNSSTIASLVSYLGRRGQVVWTVNTINDAKVRIEQQKLEVAFISLGLKGIQHKEAAEKITAECNIPCVHFNENTGMRAELALKKIEVPFKSLAPNTGPKLLAVAQAAIKNMNIQGTEDPTEQAPNRQNWLPKGLFVAEAKDIPPEGRWVQLDDSPGAPPPHTYKLTFPKNSVRSRVNFFYQGPRPPAFSRVRTLWQASTPNGVFYKDQVTESVPADAPESEGRPERSRPVYTTEESAARKGPKYHWSVEEGGEASERRSKKQAREHLGRKTDGDTDSSDQTDFGAIDHVTHDDHHSGRNGKVEVASESKSDRSKGSLKHAPQAGDDAKTDRGALLNRDQKLGRKSNQGGNVDQGKDEKASRERSAFERKSRPNGLNQAKNAEPDLDEYEDDRVEDELADSDEQTVGLDGNDLIGEAIAQEEELPEVELSASEDPNTDESTLDEFNTDNESEEDELENEKKGRLEKLTSAQSTPKKGSLLKRLFGRNENSNQGKYEESENQSASEKDYTSDGPGDDGKPNANSRKGSFLGRLFGRGPSGSSKGHSEFDLFRDPDGQAKVDADQEMGELVQLNRKPATFFENCLAESIERIASHPEPTSRLASPDRPQNYSVILIKTQSAEGYLVTPLGTEEVQEYTTFSEIIDYLKVHMQAQGEALTELSPPLLFESDPFAFLPWAQTSDHFVITAHINGFDFTCAFLVAPISAMLIREESENMMAIPRSSVCAGVKLTFDLHLALPKNDKYLLYCRANDVLTDRAVEKFAKFGVQSLYIRKQDVKAYYAYCASVTLYLERLRKAG